MPKLANSGHILSPRIRMYLVIGAVLLTSLGMVYLMLLGPTSVSRILESHSLLLLVIWTLTMALTGWLRARDPRLRAGLSCTYLGKALIVFAVAEVLLFNVSSTVPLIAFCFG